MESDNSNARLWGMLCHLSALVAYIGIPFGHIIGPFVVWLLKRREYDFVDDQGKEAINFQISMTIYGIIAGILIVILVGILFLILLPIVDLILVIIASVKSNDGVYYRYPFTIRFIK